LCRELLGDYSNSLIAKEYFQRSDLLFSEPLTELPYIGEMDDISDECFEALLVKIILSLNSELIEKK